MDSTPQLRTTNPGRQKTTAHAPLVYVKPYLVLLGSLTIVVTSIPILVFSSAVTMLVLLWPLFLGAYLEYGYVPGDSVRAVPQLGPEWYLLSTVWVAFLVVGPVLLFRHRKAILNLRAKSGAVRKPRPRL